MLFIFSIKPSQLPFLIHLLKTVDPKRVKITKEIRVITPETELLWNTGSNTSISIQDGKPFNNHTKDSLLRTQYLKANITIRLITRKKNKRIFGSSIPM